jgi:drug efflux transport system permease protein
VRAHRFWSNVLAVAYREALVVRHDKAFLGIVLAQPVMMLILFGVALSNKPANVNWAVLDRSQTTASRRLIADVEATGYFLRPQAVDSYAAGRAMLRRRQALLLVVVPRDFRRDLERGHAGIQILLDGSDPLAAARIGSYVGSVASVFRLHARPARARPPRVDPVLGAIDVRQRFWFNPTLDDHTFFLSALAGMLLTNLCLSATSLGLVGERESGTYEQLLAQPTTSVEIVLGKVAPYVAVSYTLMLVSVFAAGLFFGVWPRGSWIALCVVTLPFVLASLAIGVLVSALARSSAQAVFITVFFIMPSFVLSGVMFPYQLMPHGVREVGGLLPLRWYQIALRRIIERGAGLGDVVVPFLALSVLFGVLLAALRWRMKPRLG